MINSKCSISRRVLFILIAAAVSARCSLLLGKQSEPASHEAYGNPAGNEDKLAEGSTAKCPKIAPGMSENGEVYEPKKVEMGCGTKVKRIDDYEGEVFGKPARGNRFSKLQMGMTLDDVIKMLGEPSDKGARMSATMFNPFYFGSDKY